MFWNCSSSFICSMDLCDPQNYFNNVVFACSPAVCSSLFKGHLLGSYSAGNSMRSVICLYHQSLICLVLHRDNFSTKICLVLHKDNFSTTPLYTMDFKHSSQYCYIQKYSEASTLILPKPRRRWWILEEQSNPINHLYAVGGNWGVALL